MDPTTEILLVAAIVFVGAFVRSIFGFGDALVAMPSLAFFLDLKIASPVMAFCALVAAALLIVPSWRSIRFRGLSWLVVGAAAGVPMGAYLLVKVDQDIVKMLLAVMVIGFASWRLARPDRWTLKTGRSAWFFGWLAGLLGGAYNTGGPPIAIYSSLRRWTPMEFRSTMQGFSIFMVGFILVGHSVGGLWTPRVFTLFAWSVPGLLVAVYLGHRVHGRIPRERFDRMLLLMLFVMGAVLLARLIPNLL